jgi:hypothetical protein
MDAEQNGLMPAAADAPGASHGKAKAARGEGKNRAAAREHYARQIKDNEERLKTGLTANGTSMTANQIEITHQVIEQQREKLASLS